MIRTETKSILMALKFTAQSRDTKATGWSRSTQQRETRAKDIMLIQKTSKKVLHITTKYADM